MNECQEWLHECRETFPTLDKYTILCQYAKTPKNTLGRTKGRIQIQKRINPEKLLLEGQANIRSKRNMDKHFEIEIDQDLKKIGNKKLRKQAVLYIIIHELLHIKNKDLLALSKNYKKRKKKKIHVKEFKKQILEKYNELREMENLPKISDHQHIKLAINEIIQKIK